jgi:hypothetical protein
MLERMVITIVFIAFLWSGAGLAYAGQNDANPFLAGSGLVLAALAIIFYGVIGLKMTDRPDHTYGRSAGVSTIDRPFLSVFLWVTVGFVCFIFGLILIFGTS